MTQSNEIEWKLLSCNQQRNCMKKIRQAIKPHKDTKKLIFWKHLELLPKHFSLKTWEILNFSEKEDVKLASPRWWTPVILLSEVQHMCCNCLDWGRSTPVFFTDWRAIWLSYQEYSYKSFYPQQDSILSSPRKDFLIKEKKVTEAYTETWIEDKTLLKNHDPQLKSTYQFWNFLSTQSPWEGWLSW